MAVGLATALVTALAACSGSPAESPAPPTGSANSVRAPATGVGATSAASTGAQAASPAPSAASVSPAGWKACGTTTCKSATTPGAALAAILAEDRPLVVGFGEAHAQKGSEEIASTAWRATNELFGELGGKASDLVLELWIADPKCAPKAQAKVEKQQKQVTQTQAASNTNEYVVLAEKAKALGIQPHVIRPTCAEVDKLAKAGDDAVLEMLSMITEHMQKQVADLRSKPAAKDKIVLTYGGAMHNDLRPAEGREGWSFGPAVDAATDHRYVEIDLVVPEYVKDTPAWTGQRWYAGHLATTSDAGTTVIKSGERSYAIVMPRGVKRPRTASE